MIKPIPIVILTKDEPRFLEMMVVSIINRTKYPFKLFVVDNASKLECQKEVLEKITLLYNVVVILNKRNEWVLGFNKAIDIINLDDQLDQDNIVLSDGDIILPLIKDDICWLGYLKELMDTNIVVGKIGLALDLTFLKGKPSFNETLKLEEKFMAGPRLGSLIIAPVDTTLAIYRRDVFITKEFKMLPGHASLIKPYYYTTRTTNKYTCKHIGWRAYQKNLSEKQLEEKVYCFTRYAAYISPVVLDRLALKPLLFNKLLKKPFKIYWSGLVVFLWCLYFFKKFPRGLNEITEKLR